MYFGDLCGKLVAFLVCGSLSMSRGCLRVKGPNGTLLGTLLHRHSEPLTGSVSLLLGTWQSLILYSSRLESAYGVDV